MLNPNYPVMEKKVYLLRAPGFRRDYKTRRRALARFYELCKSVSPVRLLDASSPNPSYLCLFDGKTRYRFL